MKIIRCALLLTAVLTLVFAQTPVATVVGCVTDGTGAIIPAADVRVRNLDTNQVRTVQTDGNGDYAIANLAPGRYEIAIDKQGFHRLVQTGLELQVNQTARLDARLTVGALSETVEVTAAAPILDTENAVKGGVVEQQEIREMPLNGRNAEDLALLVPEVSDASGQNSGSNMAINGARNDNTSFVIDGIGNTDFRGGGAIARVPLDAVQEFKMQTSGYSAEYGTLAGGVMTVAIKSGGNQPHGSVFEYLRNDVLDARNFFAAQRDKLRRNQFGGSLDGPVYLPKLYNGRNRTFFLFSWESSRQVTGASKLAAVPTTLERIGDFSQTKNASGKVLVAKDPATGQNFPNNLVPASRFNPISAKLIPYYPLENRPGQTLNYLATATNINNFDNVAIKVDHSLTSRHTLAVRFVHDATIGGNAFNGSDLGNLGNVNNNPNLTTGVTLTSLFSPNLVNEFRTGLSREQRNSLPRDHGTDVATALGLTGTTNDPHLLGFPKFTLKGYAVLGDGTAQPFEPAVNAYTWADTVTWSKGRHLIKFGAGISRVQMFQAANDNARGTFKFQGTVTGVPVADLLLGLLDQSTRQVGVNRTYTFVTQTGSFFDDTIKVRRDLTLNLGLRYELSPPLHDKYDRLANFIPSLNKVVLADAQGIPNLAQILADAGMHDMTMTAKAAGLPRSLVRTSYTDFAPRVGLAWRPGDNNRTVIRSGYGIYYAGSYLDGIKGDLGGNFPFAVNQTFNRTGCPTTLTLSDPFPAGCAILSGTTDSYGYQADAPAQYMQSWNLTIEHELGRSIAIEAAYTGSKGTNLGRQYNINQPDRTDGTLARENTFFNTINYYGFGSNSIYNAGTLTLRRRFSGGIMFRGSYVFSKNIDDATFIKGSSVAGYAGAQDSRNLALERARSDFDNRHVVTMNFIYEVPRKYNRFIRGWQLAGTGRISSGHPITPQLGTPKPALGQPNRPDRITSGVLDNPTPNMWFNTSAFVTVTNPYAWGNSGRNILDGPGLVNVNLALSKRFRIGEHQSLQFRWEAFNLTNHSNFNDPSVTIDDNTGGIVSGARDPRIMQFGLRYQF